MVGFTMTTEKTESKSHRRELSAIRVYCTQEERDRIKSLSAQTGLSVSEYLRRLGLLYQPTSVMDYQKVDELLKVAADMGRLGGLLKWWLSGEAPVLQTKEGRQIRMNEATMRALLARIDKTNKKMQELCRQVIDLKKDDLNTGEQS